MKIRRGLVSNSSSSCFILDYRDPKVQHLVSICQAREPDGLNRCTAMAIGQEAISYAEDFHKETKEWYEDEPHELVTMILGWANKLGRDYIVFIRESDEEMGGTLFKDGNEWELTGPYKLLRELALEEMEFH